MDWYPWGEEALARALEAEKDEAAAGWAAAALRWRRQRTDSMAEEHRTFETALEMGDDPGLQKDGVELELQRLLAETPEVMEPGLELIRREYPTPIGPVDLLCRDLEEAVVAIEVKRRGEIDGVEQLTRYLEFLNRDERLAPVRGVLVAQTVKPQARTLAADRGITWAEVDYELLRGVDSDVLRLF